MRYAVIIEKGPTSFGAYVPDLPGCVAVGDSVEEVKGLIAEAIEFHLDGLREAGSPIPEPSSLCEYVEGSSHTERRLQGNLTAQQARRRASEAFGEKVHPVE